MTEPHYGGIQLTDRTITEESHFVAGASSTAAFSGTASCCRVFLPGAVVPRSLCNIKLQERAILGTRGAALGRLGFKSFNSSNLRTLTSTCIEALDSVDCDTRPVDLPVEGLVDACDVFAVDSES